MAIQRLVIDGYGQLELNQVAFRRDGRVEAQLPLDTTDFASVPAENGMLLAVDKVAGKVRFPDATETAPIALNYTTEHMYDERKKGLKNFATFKDGFYPRMGYLSVGDRFTTNCVSYDGSTYATVDDFVDALDDVATTPLYGVPNTDGSILIVDDLNDAPTDSSLVLAVIPPFKGVGHTMPDGTIGVKFEVYKV